VTFEFLKQTKLLPCELAFEGVPQEPGWAVGLRGFVAHRDVDGTVGRRARWARAARLELSVRTEAGSGGMSTAPGLPRRRVGGRRHGSEVN
jgi:hypothetical protein